MHEHITMVECTCEAHIITVAITVTVPRLVAF